MNVHGLDPFFNPQRIALVGVTPNPLSVGGKVLRNLVDGGFRGVVYPVNATSEAVFGIPCYASLGSVPKDPDLAVVCAAAAQVPAVVRECGMRGIRNVIIMSAGFKEAGAEGAALECQIKEEIRRVDGMRVLGPNCLGVIVPGRNLNLSFAQGMPRDGAIGFLSQSGALCASVLDWALEEKIGFSYFVSVGNALDVDFADLIDYLGEDEKTRSIILYVESIANARRFMTAARAFARNMPIVAYKAGRFPESAAVAASHTGALATADDVYDAAFRRAGIARVLNIGEIFDVVDLIGRRKTPRGPRLGIVTNAGGPGVMAVDALIARGGTLAKLAPETIQRLDECLPPFWSHGNPVDVLGDARSKRVAKAVELTLHDPGIDAVLVIITPQAMTNPTSIARAVSNLAQTTEKPILAAWIGGISVREGIGILNDAGVATYTTPEQAVRAFMTLVRYARNLESLYETPRDVPVAFSVDRQRVRADFNAAATPPAGVLSEQRSKELLEAYGIATARPVVAASEDEAASAAAGLGYPVVLKILSPDITHKSDVGGIALNLLTEASVRAAFRGLVADVGCRKPDARIQGVIVQPMIQMKDGVELLLGIKKDPIFGSTLMVGMGGIAAELYRDRALGFPPLSERLARGMLESLTMYPLLQGYRGRPKVDLDLLIEAMIRLSYVAADFPEIAELDINPLLIGNSAAVALDARVVLDPSVKLDPRDPYRHLALRPYPEEYVKQVTLKDGSPITLRPIRPEDEPLWFDMLRSCSRETIYQRFRYFFHWETHEVAARYCFIDYDREIAIVAEREQGGKRQLLGVGRLIADPDHENVEYAILVGDAWQNRGLGTVLTDYCMEIGKRWGLKRIVAQTTSDNHRMIAIFRARGFEIIPDASGSVVDVVKELDIPERER